MLHEQLAAHAELVAEGTAARVGSTNQALVLRNKQESLAAGYIVTGCAIFLA